MPRHYHNIIETPGLDTNVEEIFKKDVGIEKDVMNVNIKNREHYIMNCSRTIPNHGGNNVSGVDIKLENKVVKSRNYCNAMVEQESTKGEKGARLKPNTTQKLAKVSGSWRMRRP